MDPLVLNKEGAVIEGLPVWLVPEGLLAAVRLPVVVVQRGGEYRRGRTPHKHVASCHCGWPGVSPGVRGI